MYCRGLFEAVLVRFSGVGGGGCLCFRFGECERDVKSAAFTFLTLVEFAEDFGRLWRPPRVLEDGFASERSTAINSMNAPSTTTTAAGPTIYTQILQCLQGIFPSIKIPFSLVAPLPAMSRGPTQKAPPLEITNSGWPPSVFT